MDLLKRGYLARKPKTASESIEVRALSVRNLREVIHNNGKSELAWRRSFGESHVVFVVSQRSQLILMTEEKCQWHITCKFEVINMAIMRSPQTCPQIMHELKGLFYVDLVNSLTLEWLVPFVPLRHIWLWRISWNGSHLKQWEKMSLSVSILFVWSKLMIWHHFCLALWHVLLGDVQLVHWWLLAST